MNRGGWAPAKCILPKALGQSELSERQTGHHTHTAAGAKRTWERSSGDVEKHSQSCLAREKEMISSKIESHNVSKL